MAELWSLRGLSLRELAKRTCRRSWEDEVFGQSARLSFYFFFALFPVLLLLLVALAKSAHGGSGLRDALLDWLKQVLPRDASSLLAETIRQLQAKAVLGAGAVLAGIGSVWAALNGTWAIMSGLNKAYEVKEKRPFWLVSAIALGLTISLSALGLIALIAVLYGRRAGKVLEQHFGLPAHYDSLWRLLQWAVVALLLLVAFSLLYRFGPNLKDRRWEWSIPGAIIAVALWIAFALLLRTYQEFSSASARIYDGQAAVATLLWWLYLTGAAIFIGGEANSEIEKSATEAGHADVRKPGQGRSGGDGSSDQ